MLDNIDLTLDIEPREYKERLREAQVRFSDHAWTLYQKKRTMVVAYEGWDAGGKGGNIRRLVEALDPRSYRVHPISAPKGDDAEHHYLWRFWRRLPPKGEIGIFDRTWYGRVLVERVEGFAKPQEWRRAYGEINHFEQQMASDGAIIFKFWIHISQEEQLRRFNDRKNTNYKSWKLTDEDWRNRAKWGDYKDAVEEMLLRTSTLTAPWTVVEGNSKKFARVKTLETIVNRLDKVLS